MNPSPLKLDLASAQCASLELQFAVELSATVRRELLALGSREGDEEDRVYFHEDYRQESQKLHSWGEVRFWESGPSEVVVEYLTESELEDQIELHQTDFTLSHLFASLEGVKEPLEAFFTLRFDLGASVGSRFLRLQPYHAGVNGGISVDFRGAHVHVRTPQKEEFDLWYDLRSDDTLEATLRFTLKERPSAELPSHGLEFGRKCLNRILHG